MATSGHCCNSSTVYYKKKKLIHSLNQFNRFKTENNMQKPEIVATAPMSVEIQDSVKGSRVTVGNSSSVSEQSSIFDKLKKRKYLVSGLFSLVIACVIAGIVFDVVVFKGVDEYVLAVDLSTEMRTEFYTSSETTTTGWFFF